MICFSDFFHSPLRNLLGYGLFILVTVMVILSPYGFDLTQRKTWTPSERVWSIIIFIRKFLHYLVLSALFISLGLIVGILGYHWAAGLSWLDAKGGSFDDTSVAWARLVLYQLPVLKCLLPSMHSSVA